jgi:hypothetical protein
MDICKKHTKLREQGRRGRENPPTSKKNLMKILYEMDSDKEQ